MLFVVVVICVSQYCYSPTDILNEKRYEYRPICSVKITLMTKAIVDNTTQSTRNDACILQVQDDGKNFKMVFVRKATGIRTLYPDATPSTSAPACRGVVAIR